MYFCIFVAIKQVSFMLDYNYYDNLRKASIVPEHIRKMFEDNSKTGKIYVEMCLPFIRVANYAVTNEPKLFSDLLKKMKNAKKLPPYFHRRMLYKELYRSLVLLGDECLTCLLSELDCSDLVLNGLHDSVINHDSDAFEKVMQGWDGSFSQVTPICRLLSLELFFNDAFERIVKEENRIDEITDLNQQNQEIQAFGRKVIDVFNMKAKDIFNDAFDDGSDKRLEKTFDECLDEALKFAIDSRELDEVGYDFYKKGFMLVSIVADPNVEIPEKAPKDFFYKALLIAYGYLVTETSISRSAKRVIEETLFVPEYEAIWKQYQDLGFIDYIKEEFNLKVKTQPTPQIEEPVKEEVKDVPPKPKKIAQETDDDSETEDFRDAASEDKAIELYNVIEELLNEIGGREHEFFGDNYDLNDLKAIFESILKFNAGESIDTQRAIIDELSATDNYRITPQYRYQERLWLQPFFIIIGHLYNKGVLKGNQKEFVRALFPNKHDRNPVYGTVYKDDEQFINTCRAKISKGNTNPLGEWKKWFEWIDTLL